MAQERKNEATVDERAKLKAWQESRAFRDKLENGVRHHRMGSVKYFKDYMAEAILAGLDPTRCMPMDSDKVSFAMQMAAAKSSSAQMVAMCKESAIDPWRGVVKSWNREVGNQWAILCVEGEQMARHAMRCGATRAAVLGVLKMALETAPAGAGEKCVAEILKLARESRGATLSGASGVLGSLDQAAKNDAKLVADLKVELAKVAGAGALAKKVEEEIKFCEEFLEKKSAVAAFDPAKFKKTLSPERKERLLSIMALAQRGKLDSGAAKALIMASPWIAEEPNALCVPIKSNPSILFSAMYSGSTETIECAESMGANIWIAAAQAGKANACQWVLESAAGSLPLQARSSVARMLAYGAHLGGAQDPVSFALEKLESADTRIWFGDPRCEDLKSALKSEIEAVAIAQLLDDAANGQREAKERSEAMSGLLSESPAPASGRKRL